MTGVVMSPVLATTLRYAIIPVAFTIVGAAVGVFSPPGDLRDASASVIGRVDVQLTEIRGASQPLILQAAFAGPSYGNPGPLLGHVRRARLLTGSGEVLRDFAVEPGNTLLFILVQTEFVQDAAAFQALRSEFIAGRVSVELNTDLQGLEQLRVALPSKSAGNWERARCT